MVLLRMRLKPGNYRGSGIGIAFVVLGGRILRGKPGVFQARNELSSQSLMVHAWKIVALLPSLSKQHT